MKYRYTASFLGFMILSFMNLAQPYVVNEKVEKIFSEGFTDVNKSFIITPSSDPKFWGFYGDGYYYMQRKIAAPRAIIANAEPVSKNFYIKSKILLAPLGTPESSVGLIFLAQKGGKGGFVFEFNKRKKFRIKDLGTGAFITKEGDNGWIKSKVIAPPTRNNTIEIKGFRGKFDIYVNGNYIYSFVNSSYDKGEFGAYIGPNADAKIYYYNVYNLEIPGIAPEVNLTTLTQQIELLKQENDSLKTIALTAKYGNNDKTAISAIKILEEQLQAVNKENAQIKERLKEFEISASTSVNIQDTINQYLELTKQSEDLSFERDSILKYFDEYKKQYKRSTEINDSLNKELLESRTKISFMNEDLTKLRLEIAESKLTSVQDSITSTDSRSSLLQKKNLTTNSKKDSIQKEFFDTISHTTDTSNTIMRAPDELSEIASLPELRNIKPNSDSVVSKVPESEELKTIDSVVTIKKLEENDTLLSEMTYKRRMEDSTNTNISDSIINLKLLNPTTEKIVKSSNKFKTSLTNNNQNKSIDSNSIRIENISSISLPIDTLEKEIETKLIIDTVGIIELVKKDSLYMHTLDIDNELGIDEEKENSFEKIDSTVLEIIPLKKRKKKFNKLKKSEIKD